MSHFSADETALARSRAYTLLGRLWLDGLTPELYALVSDIAGLADHLPSSFDADEAGARHQQVLGFDLFPFQSYFLDSAGLVGGVESTRVQESYGALGFVPPDDVAPDHLGAELLALAHLTGAEADARGDGLAETAARMQALQQQFLVEHPGRWFVAICTALGAAGDPWYAALAQTTAAILADHLAGSRAHVDQATPLPPADRPDPDASATSLQDLASFLLTPVRCGLFTSQRDLRAIGRTLNLPGGFGSRRQLLLNMMRTAGAYELFPRLIVELETLVDARIGAYRAVAADIPPWTSSWLTRTQATAGLLQQLQQRSDGLQDEDKVEGGSG